MAALQELGVNVGDHVRRRADDEAGGLFGASDGKVRLQLHSGTRVRVSFSSFLEEEWSTLVPKPQPTLVEDVTGLEPSQSFEATLAKQHADIFYRAPSRSTISSSSCFKFASLSVHAHAVHAQSRW